MRQRQQAFKKALQSRQPLLGTFVKTPSSITCEVLGQTAMDSVCLDAEHSPFGRVELDSCLHALRAADMPSLVRLQDDSPPNILNALDCGATGVVVPHVKTAAQAEQVVRAAHYGRGGRGYAGSSRSAGYTGKKMSDHLKASARETTVIVQIEDIEALDEVEAIANVEGVDCLFIGRIDLTVSLGADSPQAPEVIDAVRQVCKAGATAGMAVGMFVADVAECSQWKEEGASLFLLQSDHAFLLNGARRLRQSFDESA